MKTPKANEHDEQVAVCQWMFSRGIAYYAIPNGQKRDIRIAMKLKAEGVQPGVPDLCILTPIPGKSHGLYLEMKTVGRDKEKNGGLSDIQVEWHQKLKDLGYEVLIGYGYYDTVAKLEALGY